MNITDASNKVGAILKQHSVAEKNGVDLSHTLHHDLMIFIEEYGDSTYLEGKRIGYRMGYDRGCVS